MQIWDNHERYGTVSRALHWGMAALFGWQFAGMLSKLALGRDSGVTQVLSGNHSQVGTILFLLIITRMAWAFANRLARPHDDGFAGQLARAGHLALYILMLLVPATALIRAWGGERAFAPFGFEIFAARSPEQVVTIATDIGNNLHGELGWIMAALIAGHIVMAVLHQLLLRDGSLKRMAG